MAPPKTVLDKIVHAVTKMADPTGSSRVAIVKFLKREFDLDNANAIKKALKQGVDKGSLVQKGQSFTIPGVEFQEPEDMKVSITEVTIGDGDVATKGSTVTMRYRGTLDSDGSEFDAGKIDFTLYAGEVIKGWDKGIEGMKVGGKRVLVIPPKLGYGKRGSPPEIPGDATLVFDVELLARYLSNGGNPQGVRELPLRQWTDVDGSKVRPGDFFGGLMELSRIRRRYGTRRMG